GLLPGGRSRRRWPRPSARPRGDRMAVAHIRRATDAPERRDTRGDRRRDGYGHDSRGAPCRRIGV
ncbi:MAG: hypothetical protein AVDCRST_MAG49-3076, partial [uncultured Thermomicrobiales bacterium]